MRAPREQDLVAQVLAYLALKRVFAFRVNQGAARYPKKGGGQYFVKFTSAAGVSDILGLLPGGRFLAIEAKHGRGRLRPDQVTFLDTITRAGGLALVVRSLEELRAAIDPLLDP